jgi:hypothetical protein
VTERILLDPTSERAPVRRSRAARPSSLDGKVIGLLDISKPRGDVFLGRLAEVLQARGHRIARFRKSTYTRPAPPDVRRAVREGCDVVVEGLAD